MRQEELLALLEERGPMTVRDLIDVFNPDGSGDPNTIRVHLSQKLRALQDFGYVECRPIIYPDTGRAGIEWRLRE